MYAIVKHTFTAYLTIQPLLSLRDRELISFKYYGHILWPHTRPQGANVYMQMFNCQAERAYLVMSIGRFFYMFVKDTVRNF